MDGNAVVNRINSLLAARGLSKTQFYKDCGISSAAMSQWNTGKTEPKRSTLEAIAKYLDTSVSYLENGEEPILAAFYGGDESDLTEEDREALWQDVREYYAFKLEQKRKEKRKK